MLGNLEDLRDFHKRVMLPRMEEAMEEPSMVRKLFQAEQHKLMRSFPHPPPSPAPRYCSYQVYTTPDFIYLLKIEHRLCLGCHSEPSLILYIKPSEDKALQESPPIKKISLSFKYFFPYILNNVFHTIKYSKQALLYVLKLDRVGPTDNRPSSDHWCLRHA